MSSLRGRWTSAAGPQDVDWPVLVDGIIEAADHLSKLDVGTVRVRPPFVIDYKEGKTKKRKKNCFESKHVRRESQIL